MTKVDVDTFVTGEIATRYKGGLNDTVRSDWIRAVWRAGSLEAARAIVRQIVDDPDGRLTVKMFHRLLYVDHKRKGAPLPPILNPWVLCLTAPVDHPDWQGQEGIRLDSFRPPDCATMAYVAQYAHDIAKAVEKICGGLWTGVVRPDGSPPENQPVLCGEKARLWAEKHILNGPDSPGKRFLLARQRKSDLGSQLASTLKIVTPIEPPKAATRDQIDRLRKTPTELPEPEHAQLSDEEFFEREEEARSTGNQGREPGQEG